MMADLLRRSARLHLAMRDVLDGAKLWPLWGKLGWNDILQRYRWSFLGPFWLTVSMAVMVIALGIVYSQIFKTPINDFMPFLCLGLLIWNFINTVLNNAGALFTGAESYVRQIRLPYSIYLYRFIWSNVIVFAHNAVIYLGVMIYYEVWPETFLYAIPGLLLLVLNGALASLYIGIISARFRDIPQIIVSLTQIAFYVTPIIWKPEILGSRSAILLFNPFHHLIEIVRGPLLGQLPSLESYTAVGIITAVNLAAAAAFFIRFRARISYWV